MKLQKKRNRLRKKSTTMSLRIKFYAMLRKETSKAERTEAFAAVKEESESSLRKKRLTEVGHLWGYYKAKRKKKPLWMTLSAEFTWTVRKTDEIRPIWCEIDYTSTHGFSYFHRGETQALATVT